MRPVSNPPNPWASTSVEWLGPPPPAELLVHEEQAKSLLTANESPDVPFRWSVNPYRGCTHACAYCYARPSHQYLGFGAGTDFDRRIVVKTNAPEVLARELARPGWRRELVVFSGNTDCYQPLEASYELTRRCLRTCLARRTPVGVITKGVLVRRDAELLAELAAGPGAEAFVSIPFLDAATCRAVEPGTPSPRDRFETLRALSDAGVPTGVALAPVIPGLNDAAIPEVLRRAAEAGARRAFMILLRLPAEVEPVFSERLAEALPLRAERVLSAVRELRGGRSNDPRFGSRMRGSGPRWEALRRLFEIACRRHGLSPGESPGPQRAGTARDSTRAAGTARDSASTTPPAQGELFA